MEPTLLQRKSASESGRGTGTDLARRLGRWATFWFRPRWAGFRASSCGVFACDAGGVLDAPPRYPGLHRDKGWEYGARPRRRRRCLRGSGRTSPAPGALSRCGRPAPRHSGLPGMRTRCGWTGRSAASAPAGAVHGAGGGLAGGRSPGGAPRGVQRNPTCWRRLWAASPGGHTHVDLQAEIGRLREGRPSGGGRRRCADDAAHAQGRERRWSGACGRARAQPGLSLPKRRSPDARRDGADGGAEGGGAPDPALADGGRGAGVRGHRQDPDAARGGEAGRGTAGVRPRAVGGVGAGCRAARAVSGRPHCNGC